MSRPAANGPGGSDDGTVDSPGEKSPAESSDGPVPAPQASAPVKSTRVVMLGGEERHTEPAIELTEEPEEESAAPLIDDAGPLDDDEAAALEDDLRATPPKPLMIPHREPLVPTIAPARHSSEPPANAAYRATPISGVVIPVPPPFVPFPGPPADPESRSTAHRPAVSPPPPPLDEPVPAPAVPAAPPPAPAPRPEPAAPPSNRPLSQPPHSASPVPGAGLPKVIISDEAYRPSQQPTSPAATPSVPPVGSPPPRTSPAFGVSPVAPPPVPASTPTSYPPRPLPPRPTPPVPVEKPAPGVLETEELAEVDAAEAREEEPSGETPAPAVGKEETTTKIAVARATETKPEAPAAEESPAAEEAPSETAAKAAEPEAATMAETEAEAATPAETRAETGAGEEEEVAEVDAAEAAEEEPSEESAAPLVAPPVPPRRAAVAAEEVPLDTESTDPEIVPPKEEGIGLLSPADAIRAAAAAVEDVFAPPAPPRSATARDAAPVTQSIDLDDAMPSIISIPEDDVPRTAPVPPAALPPQPATPPASTAPVMGPVPPPAPKIGRKKVTTVEVIAESDVQPVEAVEGPAGEAAAAAEPRPRPAAGTGRPLRSRRRRRHGERRPWWEEIFDEEYIRSLPRYTPEQTRNEVDFIERALGVAKTARILDLGCGEGRHAVELAYRGYEVVGLDLSVPMLARAGEAGQAKGIKINFIQGDMRDLRFEAAFDAVYCVGATFGFFDDDTNQTVLANAFRALKPGGRLLLGVTNRDYVTHNQPRSTWFQGDDRQYLEDTDFNFITSRLVVKRSWATTSGDQETVEYTIRLYSLHEMGKILHAVGFRVIEVSGHHATTGVFFGADSASLILLAERP